MKSVQIRSFFRSLISRKRTRKNSVFAHFWRSQICSKIIPNYLIFANYGTKLWWVLNKICKIKIFSNRISKIPSSYEIFHKETSKFLVLVQRHPFYISFLTKCISLRQLLEGAPLNIWSEKILQEGTAAKLFIVKLEAWTSVNKRHSSRFFPVTFQKFVPILQNISEQSFSFLVDRNEVGKIFLM